MKLKECLTSTLYGIAHIHIPSSWMFLAPYSCCKYSTFTTKFLLDSHPPSPLPPPHSVATQRNSFVCSCVQAIYGWHGFSERVGCIYIFLFFIWRRLANLAFRWNNQYGISRTHWLLQCAHKWQHIELCMTAHLTRLNLPYISQWYVRMLWGLKQCFDKWSI